MDPTHKVINLPYHLRKDHGFSIEASNAAVSQYGLRKTKINKKKSYHHKRLCNFGDCRKVVVHLGPHLLTHGLKKKTKEYINLLKTAKRFDTSKMPLNVQKSPDKTAGIIPKKYFAPPQISLPNNATSIPEYIPSHGLKFLGEQSDLDDSNDSTDTNDINDDLKSDEHINSNLPKSTQSILRSFYKYLTGPDCGRKPKGVAECIRDVKRIIIECGASQDINILFKDDSKSIRELYLVKYCTTYKIKPQSIRKYLSSLSDFCKYLKKHDNGVNLSDVKITKSNIKTWMKKYKRPAGRENVKSRKKDHKMAITPEQVQQYMNSETATQAVATAKKLQTIADFGMAQAEYCALRTHILILCLFGNACRSGVLAGMLMTEYTAAYQKPSGIWCIEVDEHKTDYKFGPVEILLPESDFQLLNTYVTYARPSINPQDESNVFLSYSGRSLTGGDLSKSLQSTICLNN